MKKDIIKILSMFSILIGIIIVLIKSVEAEALGSSWDKNKDGEVSDYDLALWTQDSGWFDWDMTNVVGKTVKLHTSTSDANATIFQKGAYCAHNELNSDLSGAVTDYKIVNILDIDTGKVASKCNSDGKTDWANYPGGLISYGQKSNNVIWYRSGGNTNSGAAYAIKLAYLAAKSTSKGETKVVADSTTGMYKRAIHDTVLLGASDMASGLGLNSAMNTGTGSVSKGDQYSWTQAQDEAEDYLNTIKTYRFDKMDTSSPVAINISGGKSYIGPLKIAHKLGTIDSVTVVSTDGNNTSFSVAGISTSIGGSVSSISNLPHATECYVVVNKEINVKVKVSIRKKFKAYIARMYFLYGANGSSRAQNVIIYKGEEKELGNTLTWEVGVSYGELKIIKKDSSTDAKLQNVGFKIKYVDGNTWLAKNGDSATYVAEANASTFITDTNGQIYIKNLKPGKYEITETTNPNPGYVVSGDKISVTVASGNITEKTINNEYQLGNLTIEKVDSSNSSKKIPGVEFAIKAISGNQSGKYVGLKDGKATYSTSQTTVKTDSNGKIEIKEVWAGKYEITEISNPNEGYIIDAKTTTATVTAGKTTVTKITIKNTYHFGELLIIKQDEDKSNVKLSGVEFTIKALSGNASGKYVKYENGKVSYQTDKVTIKTDSNGEIRLQNIWDGEYEIREVSNPNEGYLVDAAPKKVTVVASQTVKFVITNKYLLGGLIIEKRDKNNQDIRLSNVEFTVKATSGNASGKYVKLASDGSIEYSTTKVTNKTNSSGRIVFNGIWEGNYEIQEVSNPNEGYTFDGKVITATIEADSTTVKTIVVNNTYHLGDLVIIKQDADKSEIRLSGVEFTIKATSGTKAGNYVKYENGKITYQTTKVTVKTDRNGEINLKGLWEGNYEIIEVSNPNYGYVVDAQATTVTISPRKTVTKTIGNKYHLGTLKIEKVDKDQSSVKLKDVEFTIKATSGSQAGKYVKADGSGNAVYSTQKVTIKTNSNGQINLNQIWEGNYEIQEISNPNYGYLVDSTVITVTISPRNTTTQVIKNKYCLGTLKIEKVDKDQSSVKLKDVEFTIKATSGQQKGKYVKADSSGNAVYSTEKVTIKTNSNGQINLNQVWEGNYEIQEISNPNYGYLVDSTLITVTISPRNITTQVIRNKYYLGSLQIEKIDADLTDIKLKDVEFTIKATSGQQQGKYVKADSSGNAVYSTEKVTVKTDSKGQINLNKVWEGNYEIQEISNPNYGYLVDSKLITVTIVSRQKATKVITNKYHLGDLEFEKVDADNHNYKLDNVEFVIQAITGEKAGQYVSTNTNGEAVYSKDKLKVKTDSNGKLKITKLWEGEYELEEVYNPHYGYKLLDSKIKTTVKPRETAKPEQGTIENKQIYVKLSGYAWLDQLEGKVTTLNDLYDKEEPAFNGITVNLVDRNGNIIKTANTTEKGLYGEIDGGEYQFVDVLIEELNNYHIEFIYNGLKYQNVLPHIDVDNGSKAIDDASRSKLNQAFQTVNGTGSQTVSTSGGVNIGYSSINGEHVSQVENWNDNACKVVARTDDAKYVIKDHFKAGTGQEEICYINLGAKERPQTDLAAAKDLEYVRVEMNGYGHRYDYAKRFKEDILDDAWDVGVKFKTDSEYGGMEYMRPIYKADVEYTSADKTKELQVYFRYKIVLKNEASAYNARINNVVDYYDSRYTLVGATDAQGNSLSVSTTQYDSNYNKATISTNTDLNSGDANSIYVEFKLSREAVETILKDGDQNETLDNVVEINSYTSFERGTTNVVAAVDIDSVPGNAKPGLVDTYEDDTDHAPPVKLKYAEAREMSGTVFEDATTGELKTGETRQGNGKYDTASGDKGIANVNVKLAEVNDDGTIKNILRETTTDDAGNYLMSEFIPGKYKLIYNWGGQEQDGKIYTVQNYKGTVYDKSRYDANNANTYWYRNETERYTDAIDNYDTRLNIDKEVQQITNNTIIDCKNGNLTNKTMDSVTPIMEFGVEYASEQSDGTQSEAKFSTGRMDFGIVERARQSLSLNKQINKFYVTLADGSRLITGEFDENGNLIPDKSSKYLTGGVSLGYVKAEMDTEILQGATLKIGYKVSAYNNSEIDYKTKEYYLFGIAGNDSNIVTLAASGVVDYLDENYTYNPEEGWREITVNELKAYNPHCFLASENRGKQPAEFEELKGKRIMYTDKLKNAYMKPGQSESVVMEASKALSTLDDINFNNHAEIVQVNKTDNPNGSDISNHIGSILPELPEANAPELQVVPSTGEDNNYIIPITISVIALITLSGGIVLIKKKVLDKGN